MDDECKNPRPWYGITRCNFQPRYTEGPAQQLSTEQIAALSEACVWSDDLVEAIKSMTGGGRTYLGEVCAKCGIARHAVTKGREA